ncbi:hypothetical protein QQF64_002999 [Cirrhinus molitorella]|uniref:Uncharacterized protein n=1 Tax=Cirrhinus molitorella TaxID=172907 RepID=A0ABR3MKQ0_9TELE
MFENNTLTVHPPQDFWSSDMNKMKNFKRRFSLSVPRTETIEENEFTEQINQLNIRCNDGTALLLTFASPVRRTSLIWERDASCGLPEDLGGQSCSKEDEEETGF